MVDDVCHFTEGIISRRYDDGKEREREKQGKGLFWNYEECF